MKYRRKYPRRRVRCTMCTRFRWLGNHGKRPRPRDLRLAQDDGL